MDFSCLNQPYDIIRALSNGFFVLNLGNVFSLLSPLVKVPSFEQTWNPIIHGCLASNWLKLAKCFIFCQCFFFVISELNHHESPSTKDASCQVWLKLSRWFWRKFLNLAMSFRCFVTMTLIKGEALHLKNLESPLPKNALWQVEIFTMVRRIFF